MFKKLILAIAATLIFSGTAFAQDNQSNKSTTAGSSQGLLGISLDLNTMKEWNIVYNASSNLSIIGILGFSYYTDDHDDNTNITIGIGASFLITQQLLPISIEGDLKYNSDNAIQLDALMALALPVLPHFNLVGKAGLEFTAGTDDPNPRELSPLTKISAVWFFI